jgi:hypothetical protein
MSRIYLGHRDVRSPEAARTAARDEILGWHSTEVRNALGQKFRASMRVELVCPWWMPGPLYQRLLRSIVVETRAERTR